MLDINGLLKFHTNAIGIEVIRFVQKNNKDHLESPGIVFGYYVPYFSGLYRGAMNINGIGDFVACLTALPFSENSLRNILILHHCFHKKKLLQVFEELFRVLEDEGHVSIVIPYRTNWGLWRALRMTIPSSLWIKYALSHSFQLVYRFSCGFMDMPRKFWLESIGCGFDVLVFRKREACFSSLNIADQSIWLNPFSHVQPARIKDKGYL